MTASSRPLVYLDACVFLEVLQRTHSRWRDSFKVLRAAERGDIGLVASRLLAVEVGRWRGDASRRRVDELVLRYLEQVETRWVEVDLLISRDARALSWKYGLKSGADAVHLATAVRMRAAYFMSRDGTFPYSQTIDSTLVTEPTVVWTPTLEDAEVDSEPDQLIAPALTAAPGLTLVPGLTDDREEAPADEPSGARIPGDSRHASEQPD